MLCHKIEDLSVELKEYKRKQCENDEFTVIKAYQEETCIICFENYVNILIVNCSHQSICSVCLEGLKKKECPICREKIGKVLLVSDLKKIPEGKRGEQKLPADFEMLISSEKKINEKEDDLSDQIQSDSEVIIADGDEEDQIELEGDPYEVNVLENGRLEDEEVEPFELDRLERDEESDEEESANFSLPIPIRILRRHDGYNPLYYEYGRIPQK